MVSASSKNSFTGLRTLGLGARFFITVAFFCFVTVVVCGPWSRLIASAGSVVIAANMNPVKISADVSRFITRR